MITNISSINMNYEKGNVRDIEVHFTMNASDHSISTSGYFIFSKEEFESKTIDELTNEVKDKFVNRIVNPVLPENSEEEPVE